jgi:hypothetical protein
MGYFEVFSKTVSKLPAQVILQTLDAECKDIRDDLENLRREATPDDLSILSFSEYVRSAKEDIVMRCSKLLPLDHVEFYKETVVRLIHVGALPISAMEQFDYTFSLKD